MIMTVVWFVQFISRCFEVVCYSPQVGGVSKKFQMYGSPFSELLHTPTAPDFEEEGQYLGVRPGYRIVFPDEPIGKLASKVILDQSIANDDISEKDLDSVPGKGHSTTNSHHQHQPEIRKAGSTVCCGDCCIALPNPGHVDYNDVVMSYNSCRVLVWVARCLPVLDLIPSIVKNILNSIGLACLLLGHWVQSAKKKVSIEVPVYSRKKWRGIQVQHIFRGMSGKWRGKPLVNHPK